jgi:hypothetical protein
MSYKFQCAQCQRGFNPTHVNFVRPVSHQHFDSIECRDAWVREWEAIYGRAALPDRRNTPEENEQLMLDFI